MTQTRLVLAIENNGKFRNPLTNMEKTNRSCNNIFLRRNKLGFTSPILVSITDEEIFNIFGPHVDFIDIEI